jgi:hypothetical protein
MSSPIFHRSFDESKIYYQVDCKKTYSKTEAIAWAGGQTDRIQFCFLDEIFDQLDWTSEPELSIEFLQSRRAREIREQYDFVSIQYSGGYDSQTIVDTFINNGLQVDELVILKKSYLATQHWQNLESSAAVKQALVYKKLVWPKLSIKEISLDLDHTKNFFLTHKNNWVDHTGNDLWITRMSRQHLYNYQKDFVKTVDSYNSHAMIEGKEKPRLWIENGAWYSTMIDATITWDLNSRSLPFYYSDAELYAKQSWGMLNWLESLPLSTVDELHTLLHQVQSHKTNLELYRDWNFSLGRSPVHNMYSYNPMPLKGNRWSGDPRTVEESQILSKHFENTKVLDYYHQGVNEYLSQYGDAVLDPNRWNIWSKKYFMKPVEPGKNFKKTLSV